MKRSILLICVGVVVVIIIAILAGYTGNVAIRRVQQQGDAITLEISQPVVLGVATIVRWQVPTGTVNTPVALRVRTSSGEVVLGNAKLADRSITVSFACTLTSGETTLVLADERTGEILSWLPLTLLPAGQDCLR